MAPILRAGKSIYLRLGETAMRGSRLQRALLQVQGNCIFCQTLTKRLSVFIIIVEFPRNTITSDVQLTASENADNFLC